MKRSERFTVTKYPAEKEDTRGEERCFSGGGKLSHYLAREFRGMRIAIH